MIDVILVSLKMRNHSRGSDHSHLEILVVVNLVAQGSRNPSVRDLGFGHHWIGRCCFFDCVHLIRVILSLRLYHSVVGCRGVLDYIVGLIPDRRRWIDCWVLRGYLVCWHLDQHQESDLHYQRCCSVGSQLSES